MVDITPVQSATKTPEKDSGSNGHAQYIALSLVPVFFLLGLLGVLICHILKRKGYRCTTEAEDNEALEDAEKDPECVAELNDTFSDANNDTLGRIVHCIMKNEANSDALTAMVAEHSAEGDRPTTPTTPVSPNEANTPLSPGAPPGAPKHTCSHLHTVGGVAGQKSICSRCNQKKWPLVRRPSRSRPSGQVTVLSVGRFRVTKCDPKSTRERRSLRTSDPNGSVPSSPTEPKSRTPSESQEKQDKGPI
ncbi:RELT-like protein 1 [Paramormyrops kingsleyae]|uniref:RELT like 1 n=1 Tax=Paramormyrops kingsleyae TaxID=1676925 RepID=A0A3B3SLT5_9TELE|nr:RELT-like protein 1 [Paramormyrops kingsleyae]